MITAHGYAGSEILSRLPRRVRCVGFVAYGVWLPICELKPKTSTLYEYLHVIFRIKQE